MNQSSLVRLDVDDILLRYDSQGRLGKYYELLMAENVRVNLVSRETARSDFDRMVAESLAPLDLLEGSFGSYLDIGSGGGIPGIPLMLSGRISGSVWLVERTQKKTAAMRRILAGLDLDAELLATTFEEVKLTLRFDLITLRYVKLTPQLLRRILPALTETGRFVYYSKPEFPVTAAAVDVYSYAISAEDFVKSLTVFSRKL